MKPVPCTCCGEPQDVDIAKNGRPYLTCWPCGAQTFVKGRRGMKMLETTYGAIVVTHHTGTTPAAAAAPAAPAARATAAAPAPAPTKPAVGGHRARKAGT